jgi:predicted DsbA family dithiol-disulfide isomerase
LDRLEREGDVTIEWHAFELRPPGSPPMPPERRAGIEARRPQFVARAREQYGFEINSGPFDVDSRPALIGEQFAKDHGAGRAFHDAVMRAYWQEAAVIDDRTVLADLAVSVGLDRAAFLAALDDPRYERAVVAEVATAHDAGITAVPALVFDERYLVLGAQPYALLRQVVDQCHAEQRGAPTG